MSGENIILKKPLVSVWFCIMLGSLVYASGFSAEYLILSIALFIIMSLYGGYKITAFIFLFFVLSIVNNFYYYSIPYVKDGNFSVRITGKSFGDYTGLYNGRKISVKTGDSKLKTGSSYLIRGNLIPDCDKEEGTAGVIYLKGGYFERKDIISTLFNYKEKVYTEIKDITNKETAAVISAISFGYVDELSMEQKNNMKYWGLIHIVSVSGFHMALIYKILEKVSGYKAALAVCAFYVIFTGASAPALRAFIMIIVMKLGEKTYREYNPISSLAFSGILICLTAPYSPMDLGFQLSYLATAGIIFLNNKLNKCFYVLPKYIREALSISISPQVFTFPTAGLSIGSFSLNSLLSNLILMPFFSLIVILGNLLLIVYSCRGIFFVIVRLSEFVYSLTDRILGILEYISLPLVNTEREVIYFYVICLGCYYFAKEGFHVFKVIPAIVIIPLIIYIYSPFVKINIDKGKELRVSYRGNINRYNIMHNKIKSGNNYLDTIQLGSSGDYLSARENKIYLKLQSSDVYCFSLINNTQKYDIITIDDEEVLIVLWKTIIRF